MNQEVATPDPEPPGTSASRMLFMSSVPVAAQTGLPQPLLHSGMGSEEKRGQARKEAGPRPPRVAERRRGVPGRAGQGRPHLGPLCLCSPSQTEDNRRRPTERREASEPTLHSAGKGHPGWVAGLSLPFSPAATRRQVRTGFRSQSLWAV